MNTYHRAVASVPTDLYDRVNRLLAIESLDGMTDQQLLDVGANTDQNEGILYVEFDDGSHLNYNLRSGQHNYYDDVVWSSPDGRRDVTLDCEYSLNDIEFQIDDDTYFVEVVRGNKKAVHSYDYEGVSETVAQTRDGKFTEPSCIIPEKDNVYPLFVGNGQTQCNTCSFYAKLEAEL